jgi:hypothetical protein
MFSLSGLAPVIPLGATIMAAGYANRIYGLRTVPNESDVPGTFPLRFKLVVEILCNSGIRSGDLRDDSCEACQLRLKILSSPLRIILTGARSLAILPHCNTSFYHG